MWKCCQYQFQLSMKGESIMELEDRIVAFAARCVKVCAALPVKNVGSASFADQLFRSSTSVAANYAEACEAESGKDFVHKLKVSMKELSETRIWLKLIGAMRFRSLFSGTVTDTIIHFHLRINVMRTTILLFLLLRRRGQKHWRIYGSVLTPLAQ